ncbi:MAG: GbsR/MarR family transcriptional regulator [Pseudobdellovibrio sp.]
MNNMKSPESNLQLRNLSLSIGQFIRYWGFRRIHGAIWAQLYLSKMPLSCTQLAGRLGLSKSLISPALEELCGYRLIQEVVSLDDKTKLYSASENINEVIQHVLKTRESKMLKQITQNFERLKKSKAASKDLDTARLNSLEEMIYSANTMLEILLQQDDVLQLPSMFEN